MIVQFPGEWHISPCQISGGYSYIYLRTPYTDLLKYPQRTSSESCYNGSRRLSVVFIHSVISMSELNACYWMILSVELRTVQVRCAFVHAKSERLNITFS